MSTTREDVKQNLRNKIEESTGIIGETLRARREAAEKENKTLAQVKKIKAATEKINARAKTVSSMQVSFIQISKNFQAIAKAFKAEVTLQSQTNSVLKETSKKEEQREKSLQKVSAPPGAEPEKQEDPSMFGQLLDAVDLLGKKIKGVRKGKGPGKVPTKGKGLGKLASGAARVIKAGVVFELATHHGALNANEDEELAKRRAQPFEPFKGANAPTREPSGPTLAQAAADSSKPEGAKAAAAQPQATSAPVLPPLPPAPSPAPAPTPAAAPPKPSAVVVSVKPATPISTAPPVATSMGSAGGDKWIMDMIKHHEGAKAAPYKDSLGLWTVGVGHLIGNGFKGESSPPANWRSIIGMPGSGDLSKQEIDQLFMIDYTHHKELAMKMPGWKLANEKGQAALIDLTFNMGAGWASKFKKGVQALLAGDFKTAAEEFTDSAWFKQVKGRAVTVVGLMREGLNAGGTPVKSQPSSGTQIAQTSAENNDAKRKKDQAPDVTVVAISEKQTITEPRRRAKEPGFIQTVGT